MIFRAAETEFHEEASRACGLDDFGDDDYLEGLRALLAALDDEAPLNEIGRAMFRTNIVAALVGRLHSEHGWSTHPEHAEAAIDGPLVIMGLPRTGTTALQHLLAQDPSLQALELWISTSPKPRLPRARWHEDPDFRACDERMRVLHANSPDLMAIHPMAAHLPDECWHLTTQHFAHSGYEAQTHVPSYSRWWEGYDMGPAWRRHRKNIQLIGYREPGRRCDARRARRHPQQTTAAPSAHRCHRCRSAAGIYPSFRSPTGYTSASVRHSCRHDLDQTARHYFSFADSH